MTEKRFKTSPTDYFHFTIIDTETDEKHGFANTICDLLNNLHEENQELLRYKYLVKALEEVSADHYIEELIADFTDGEITDEKKMLKLGKFHSENGLSWEDLE